MWRIESTKCDSQSSSSFKNRCWTCFQFWIQLNLWLLFWNRCRLCLLFRLLLKSRICKVRIGNIFFQFSLVRIILSDFLTLIIKLESSLLSFCYKFFGGSIVPRTLTITFESKACCLLCCRLTDKLEKTFH